MQLIPQNFNWNKEPTSLNGSASARVKTAKSGLLKIYTQYSESNMDLKRENLNVPGSLNNYNLTNQNLFVNASWKGEIAKRWILTTGYSFTQNADQVVLDSSKYNEHLTGNHAKIMINIIIQF